MLKNCLACINSDIIFIDDSDDFFIFCQKLMKKVNFHKKNKCKYFESKK